ncbi:MAG: hypothetical protein PHD76_03305 [Methylacidiphilales bacterium]|nr:hypothetical protein [Candidatus Methylacidiphilales bacterium]
MNTRSIALLCVSLIICTYIVSSFFAKTAIKAAETGTSVIKEPIQDITKLPSEVLDSIKVGIKAVWNDKLADQQREIDRLNIERSNLDSEINRLRSQSVKITDIQTQLTLNVISCDESIWDCKKIAIQNDTYPWFDPNPMHRDYTLEYVGVMELKYKKNIGIDLEKLRFKLDRNSRTILIDGFDRAVKTSIDKIPVEEWKMSEIRKLEKPSKLYPYQTSSIISDPSIENQKAAQKQEVVDRTNTAPVPEYLQMLAKQLTCKWLTALFSLADYRVEVGSVGTNEGFTSSNICTQLHENVDNEIQVKSKAIEKNDALLRNTKLEYNKAFEKAVDEQIDNAKKLSNQTNESTKQ